MGCCEFSDVTNMYLKQYKSILDEMITGMTKACLLNNSISHNFIVQMIPHHRAAIEMSRNLLKYTTFIPLQRIAKNIIAEQTQSIQDMESVIERCDGYCNLEKELCVYGRNFEKITEQMFTDMKNAPAGNNININFMREMIPHHCGAVQMSESALRFRICPELIPILQAIIRSQKRGIQEMKELLCQCGETY